MPLLLERMNDKNIIGVRLFDCPVVRKIERAESVSDLCQEIALLDPTNWIAKAWSETAPSTLTKCFKTTGFPVTAEQEDYYEDEDEIPLSLIAQQL